MSLIGLDFADLGTLYDYGRVRTDEDSYVRSEPTPSSLEMIGKELGCDVPADFVTFALECPGYTTYFALLGDDISATGALYESHIVALYRLFPGDYVHLAQPRIDRNVVFRRSDPEGPIFQIEDDGSAQKFIEIASCFRHYLEDFVISLAIGERTATIGRRNVRALDEREKYVWTILEKYSRPSKA